MSHIINRKVGNTIYVYEQICYRENGRVRTKQKILGKLDADGNVIPSKKSASVKISLESLKASLLKASLNSLDDSPNSQNSQNVNATNDVTVFENNSDMIITASTSTDATATPATVSTITAITTATNDTIADTAATATTAVTTVADNSSDAMHNNTNNTSDMMSGTNTTVKTTPVATDNSSYYDIPAETHTEAPAVYYESSEAQTSSVAFIAEDVIIDNTSDIVHEVHKTDRTEGTEVTLVPDLSALPDVANSQDPVGLVILVDTTQESAGKNPSQLPQVVSQKADQFKVNMSKIENIAFTPSKNASVYEATDINTVKVNVSRGKSPKKRIETLLYIDFNDAKVNGLDISHEDRLTPYDREIHNAVATLAAAGNICINPYMIFQVLSGNSSDKSKSGMSLETRENIVKSLNKMRLTNVKIMHRLKSKQE